MAIDKRDVERLFLQAIFSRGVVSEKVAKLLHKKCVEAVNTAGELQLRYDPGQWEGFVTNLNNSLNKLDFEFRSAQDENSGTNWFAMVNRKGDEIAQLATDYTPAEISFLKAVIEQIMFAPNEAFSVSSMAALRETKMNMTKAQAETLLSTFVAKGWLTKSKRGRYALAVRSTLELLPYLQSNYAEEFLECTICHMFMTRGIACINTRCNIRMHHHCAARYMKLRNGNACPTCTTAWPSAEELIPVGEEAARGDEEIRRRTRAATQGSDDEEEAEYSGQDEEPSQTQRKGKGKGKGKQKKRTVDSDDDAEMVDEDEDAPQVKEEPRRSSRRQ
ncbi:hypothetical protein D9611_004625 [Ephemerocybe angulata]|uniref:Nse1 non-SMC component of SMC5-6 complex-domain-containing protein n=2 Tax=Ephemerocybe angulata TaxID=980116 RepID=A0A8H6IGD1_9AGAR|nr:hypothetical protein D9611_004625 [Tulosesus angulatus]KAF6765130.1 Nse1 non-SMC component of SMC5-6 complex-domain-containing protein [Tulosesus angulatus]